MEETMSRTEAKKTNAITTSRLAATIAFVGISYVLPLVARGQPVPESVYPAPLPGDGMPFSESRNSKSSDFWGDDRSTARGVGAAFEVRYSTDHIFRGFERFETETEDKLNLQLNGKIKLDLGKLPHPYIEGFVNIAESDPISSFQEVRPTIGFDWALRPFILSAGHTNYIFPDREALDTNEVFLKLQFDDSDILRRDRPLFSPYVLGVFDYDTYDGVYAEVGLRHSVSIDSIDLVLTLEGHVSYVNGHDLFAVDPTSDDNSGFQHYQVGLSAVWGLNQLMNIPDRFGRWSVVGYLNYTDGIDNDLINTTQLWGGAGFRLDF
jgi:hypothetical protein